MTKKRYRDELNKLFVCSNCGKSISKQLDNLDLIQSELVSLKANIIMALNKLKDIKKITKNIK